MIKVSGPNLLDVRLQLGLRHEPQWSILLHEHPKLEFVVRANGSQERFFTSQQAFRWLRMKMLTYLRQEKNEREKREARLRKLNKVETRGGKSRKLRPNQPRRIK